MSNMNEPNPLGNTNREIDPQVKQSIIDQFGKVEEVEDDYVYKNRNLALQDYSPQGGYFSLVETAQNPSTFSVDYLLTDPSKKSRVKREIKQDEEKGGLHHASIYYEDGDFHRDYFFTVNHGPLGLDRRLGINHSYIPPEIPDQDDIFSDDLPRNIFGIYYGEGKNTVEGESTIELELPLMEVDEIKDWEGTFFDEDRTVTITFLQKHSLVRIKYPNPAYTQEKDFDKKLLSDTQRSLSRRFKEGEVIALDSSVPYRFKATRENGNIRVIRANTEKNTSWELTFPQQIDFDGSESQIQAQRGVWDRINQAIPVSINLQDTNLLADDPTYSVQLEAQQAIRETSSSDDTDELDTQDRTYRQAVIEKALLIPPGQLPKRLKRIGEAMEQIEEEEYGYLSPEERTRLRREYRDKRQAAAQERLRRKQEIGIKAQQFAESYPIYEVYVTDEVEADPFNKFHIFYQAAKEAVYDIKVVVPPLGDDQAAQRPSPTSERLIVMASTEDARDKLDELQKLSWRHKRYAVLEWIEEGEPRPLLELIRGNEEKVYGDGVNVWAATRKQGIPIEDVNFLQSCFMRAEQRRRERHEKWKKEGHELSTEHLFNETSRMFDELTTTVKPVEQEELVKNFVPAIKELLLVHPQLVPTLLH